MLHLREGAHPLHPPPRSTPERTFEVTGELACYSCYNSPIKQQVC